MSELPLPEASRCSSCGLQLAPALLVCPACHALVHRERLEALATRAAAERDCEKATLLWREALSLLPPGSKQYEAVEERIAVVNDQNGWSWLLLSPVTLISVLVSMVVYTTAWGVPAAAGVIVAVYIHEMGHLVAARRRGLRVGPPVFVPGLGAFVPLKQKPATPSDDARIGLAGPLFGLFASVAALIAYIATGGKLWGEIARFSAVLNLLNLAPIWELDGARGFRALTRAQRWLILLVLAATFAITREKILIAVALAGVWRAFEKSVPEKNDWVATGVFAGLVVAFAALATVRL